jgi:hypothetical protein
MAAWTDLVAEVRAAGDERVFISSEWLCRATEKQARRVVRALGGERVHIAATLRPLAKILPSAWQQYVKDGYTGDYESWLDGTLRAAPDQSPTPWFWVRHRHDVVLARWAQIVGTERVTAIVVDSRDQDLLLRQFEALLALPAGFLVGKPAGKRNASLTWPEAELLRKVNAHFQAQNLPDDIYAAAVRSGILPKLADARTSLVDPTPIVTPRWALERAAEIGAAAADAIEASGIRVLGDLRSLGAPPDADEGLTSLPPDPAVEVVTAAQAIVGALVGTKGERPPLAPKSRWRRGRKISPIPEF